MWTRATRWAIAALIGSAMTTIGCARPPREAHETLRTPILADDGLVHALDTSLEMRVVDRLELGHYLRDRDIRIVVIDGIVTISGEVWTALERQRVGDLVRNVAGMIDVANELDIRPPE